MSEFWLGNEKIHAITSTGTYEVRVYLKYNCQSKYALYDKFSIADESNNYKVRVESYSGTAGDSLTGHNDNKFNTVDRDDGISENCAARMTGARWYGRCCDHMYSSLKGKWKSAKSGHRLNWKTFTRNDRFETFTNPGYPERRPSKLL